MASRYLHSLPIRLAEGERNVRSNDDHARRAGAVAFALALLSISAAAAMALVQLAAGLHNDVPAGWPSTGCLSASTEPLGAQEVVGKASLCRADDGIHGVLNLDNLEPNARYIVWIAYTRDGRSDDPGPPYSQWQASTLACNAARMIVHAVAHRLADARGVLRVDEPVRAIDLAPHSSACLVVAPPQWSPVPHPSYRLIEDNTSAAVARAVFDMP